MKILLDTQCWLWWIAAPEKLNQSARRRIADKRNTVYLSAASSWEIAIKYSIGKLPLPEPPLQFIPKRLARDAITALPIEITHTLYVADLPRHHKDPFDRILISQSIKEDIPIMMIDKRFEIYSGYSATELSKKFGVSQPSVSISVKRGEQIAKAEQLELVED